MAWSAPITPVSGTVITVAFAQSSIVTPINWLRGLTGNADPPSVGHVARSTSTTLTAWYDLDTALATGLAARVDRVPPLYTDFGTGTQPAGSGFFDVSPATADGPAGAGDYHLIQTRHRNYGVDYRLQIAANIGSGAELWFRRIDASGPSLWWKLWHAGNDGAGSGLDADLLDGQSSAFYATASSVAAIVQVPLSGVIWFPTLANLTAAGASWTRHTAADGRLLVGAGTAGSPAMSNPQTFAEATNYGTDWGHTHGSGAMSVTGGTDGPSLLATVQSGTGVSVGSSLHGHTQTSMDVLGSTDASVWLPGMRAGVYGRRI